MKNKTSFIIGMVFIGLFTAAAVFAPLIAPYDPNELVDASFCRPSAAHLLGTNDIGQDIFSELVYGTRYSLLIGLLTALISGGIALVVGILAGWFGGIADRILMNVATFVITIPYYPLVILLAALTRGGLVTTSLILGMTSWPEMARVVRAQTMKIRQNEYITSIRAMGAGSLYIMGRHILPELSLFVFYRMILRFRSAILAESSLSFLGLGSATAKSWGTILFYAQNKNAFLTDSWAWWVIPPGLAILILVFSLFLVSYSLEEKAAPRMSRDPGGKAA